MREERRLLMLKSRFADWLGSKWRKRLDAHLAQSYQVTFSSLQGREVLQHLMDEVYCQVCPVNDPIALATHNGRRSVVQEILEAIDIGEQPDKYSPREETTHAT